MCCVMGYFGNVISMKEFRENFARTTSRGPDSSRILEKDGAVLGFQRLAIMGLDESGMQPFSHKGKSLVCNGEIYGIYGADGKSRPWREVREELVSEGFSLRSSSDCEILLPLYEKYGTDLFGKLDAEYALIICDEETGSAVAARDPIGIRPLYYGKDGKGGIAFASEPKNLEGLVDKILPFPPGHYYKDGKFTCYRDITKVGRIVTGGLDGEDGICKQIHDRLVAGIQKRLDADAPLGFLLSGGLDSSLVCAVSARLLKKPIETFAIGMKTDAIDLKYAKQVADYIGSNHHEIIISKEDVLSALEEVIYALGTFDITTIRASMGMYLICKAIHEQTDIRVLLTGEISDELFGYKYTDFAPSAEEFQEEARKRVRELHMYDVLRADRCISVNSLEARVPFGDLDFVEYVMSVDPELKMNRYGKGKFLLRHAFEKDADGKPYLPHDLLMREKAAFSDAVGHSLVDDLKEFAETKYTDKEFGERCKKYEHARPFTKESLLYREIFEKFYPGQSQMIVDFWMPNKSWEGCDVNDPSARVLSNYGDSGK
ncbi:MAG: asparagine synthase B [Treponema sp.]|nr:asparagine synthase B [Treponema sp.]